MTDPDVDVLYLANTASPSTTPSRWPRCGPARRCSSRSRSRRRRRARAEVVDLARRDRTSSSWRRCGRASMPAVVALRRADRRRRDRRGPTGAGGPGQLVREYDPSHRLFDPARRRRRAARTWASTPCPSPRCCSGHRRRVTVERLARSRPASTPRSACCSSYGDGRSALLTTSLHLRGSPGKARVVGTRGLDRRPPALPPAGRLSCCTAPAPSPETVDPEPSGRGVRARARSR